MEEIFGGIFLEKFFGRIFTRIVWEELLGRNYLFYSNVEGIDLFVKTLVFVKILSKSRGKEGSLEVRLQEHRT